MLASSIYAVDILQCSAQSSILVPPSMHAEYPPDVPFVALRVTSALFGVATVVTVHQVGFNDKGSEKQHGTA